MIDSLPQLVIMLCSKRCGNHVTLWNEGQRLKQYDFYVQDERKLRRNLPHLQISLGYVTQQSIDGSQGLVTFVHADRWFNNNNAGAIAPRLGIAWSPGSSGKTVVRSGWGIEFDTVSSFQVTAVAGKVPGLVFSCSSTVGGATTPGCQTTPDDRSYNETVGSTHASCAVVVECPYPDGVRSNLEASDRA